MLNLEFPPVAWRSLLIFRNFFVCILFISSIYLLYNDTIQMNENKQRNIILRNNYDLSTIENRENNEQQQQQQQQQHYSLDKEQNWQNKKQTIIDQEQTNEVFHFVTNWGGYVYSNISSRSRSLFLLQWKLGESEFKGLLGVLILMWSNLITIAVFLLLFSIYMLGFALLMFVLISEG